MITINSCSNHFTWINIHHLNIPRSLCFLNVADRTIINSRVLIFITRYSFFVLQLWTNLHGNDLLSNLFPLRLVNMCKTCWAKTKRVAQIWSFPKTNFYRCLLLPRWTRNAVSYVNCCVFCLSLPPINIFWVMIHIARSINVRFIRPAKNFCWGH